MRLCRALPREYDARAIARQLVRSGTSVAANHRAACRARSRKEFIAKIGVVVEEADETQVWLDLLDASGLVRAESLRELAQEARELPAIFTASFDTARARQAAMKTK